MPDKIVFSGVGKTTDEIKYALKKIKQLNVESEEELEEIAEIAKKRKKCKYLYQSQPRCRS